MMMWWIALNVAALASVVTAQDTMLSAESAGGQKQIPKTLASMPVSGDVGWQPIETAPEGGELLLACRCETSGTQWVTTGSRYRGGWLNDDEGTLPATHWMHKPEPPAQNTPGDNER